MKTLPACASLFALLTATAFSTPFAPSYDLLQPPGAETGGANLLAYGKGAADNFGRTVRTGDVNGDGVADLIVGANAADAGLPARADSGAVYVWFGQAGMPAVLDAAGSAGGAPDVVIWGATSGDQISGGGALAVGDLNGDGADDLIIGTPFGDGPAEARANAGEVYVVFGRAVFPPVVDLGIQGSGGADVTLYGGTSNDNLSSSGALAVGDLTGDGIADLILGAPLADGPAETRLSAGEAYIITGRAAFPAVIDLGLPSPGGADVTIFGGSASDFVTMGGSVRVGDVNGDGITDLLLGASAADGPAESRSSAGEVYVIFGRSSFPATLSLEIQGEGGADVTVWGATANDQLGASGGLIAGDFDGDGICDLLLGASGGDGPGESRGGCGEAYLIRGRQAFPPVLDAGADADLTIFGATAADSLTSGGALALGDVNRDGVLDLILGAPLADGPGETRTSAGEAVIIFGGPRAEATLDLAEAGGGVVTIYGATGGDNLTIGRTLAVTDLNGNGYADIILGAPLADGPGESRSSAGEACIIRGRARFPATLDLAAAGAAVTLHGATANDQLTSGGALAVGDINGDGIADLILGAGNGDGPGEARVNAGEVAVLLGVAAPEIDVAQPAHMDLEEGGSRSFGSVGLEGAKRMTFTIRNTGSADLSGVAAAIAGADAALFTLRTPPAATVAPGGTTSFTVVFAPDGLGARTAAVHISSNDEDEAPFVITLDGTGVTPVPPLVVTGEAEWLGAGAVLKGMVNAMGSEREVVVEYGPTPAYGAEVTATPFTVDGSADVAVQATISGLLPRTLYHFRVRAAGDLGGAAGEDATFISPNHPPVAVTDVIRILPGATAVLDLVGNDTDAEGDPLRVTSFTKILPANDGKLAWAGDTVVFTASARFNGATFSYTIDDGYGGSATGTVHLIPGACALNPAAMIVAAAGGTYPISVTADGAWSVGEKASWLEVTPAAGTGDATVWVTVLPHHAKNERTKSITIGGQSHTVTQTGGRAPVTEGWPATLTGAYHGLVGRHATLNANLGSRLDLTTTGGGALSGKLTTGGATQSFTGQFTADAEQNAWHAVIALGQNKHQSLTLELVLDGDVLAGQLRDGALHAVAVAAWPRAADFPAYAGSYRFDLTQPDPHPSLPQGSGHGAFTVAAATGSVILTGTLSDNSVFIGSTFIGAQGQVLVYQPLYGNGGSLAGALGVAPGADGVAHALAGALTWFAATEMQGPKKILRAGFGPLSLSASGESW